MDNAPARIKCGPLSGKRVVAAGGPGVQRLPGLRTGQRQSSVRTGLAPGVVMEETWRQRYG